MSQADLVQAVLRLLAELGVRECCVAAGARNAPLMAALLASRGLRVRHFFEERSAAFFALGRVMDSGRPVAVVTTSGTAAAELLPAMIEAHYQGLPLIALTADRPRSYRGSGAPQAIEQVGLFGAYVSGCHDVESASEVPKSAEVVRDRPWHLNVCLDEPLETNLAGLDFATVSEEIREGGVGAVSVDFPDLLAKAKRPVVLAAGLSVEEALAARPLLVSLGAPVLAEATSQLWSPPVFDAALAPLLLPATDAVFTELRPDAVLRLGAVPALRAWRDLEAAVEVPVVSFSRVGFPGLARKERVVVQPWSALPKEAPACLPWKVAVTLQKEDREGELLRALSRALGPQASVFLGNSLPIREMNAVMAPLAEGVTFHANRGANGIDGVISTWLGKDAEAGGDSWLVLGDLSALYDLAGPWVLPQLQARRRFLVIVNNGGGRIFSKVASLRSLPESAREVIENRHALSFRPFAELWGMSHHVVREASDWAALKEVGEGTHVVEMRP